MLSILAVKKKHILAAFALLPLITYAGSPSNRLPLKKNTPSIVACDHSGKKCVGVGTVPNNYPCDGPSRTGEDIVFYISSDAQNTWHITGQRSVDGYPKKLHLKCTEDTNKCVLAGSYGSGLLCVDLESSLIYATTNGGENWSFNINPMKGMYPDCMSSVSGVIWRYEAVNDHHEGNNWILTGKCFSNDLTMNNFFAINSSNDLTAWKYADKQPIKVEHTDLVFNKIDCDKNSDDCLASGTMAEEPVYFLSHDNGNTWNRVKK